MNSRALLSGKRDSNSRPRPWQGRALPTELLPQVISECKYTFFIISTSTRAMNNHYHLKKQ